ncbi:type 2 lantipeptide synthetase LanM [Nostoc flagelliforme FACHB-838]|uniref:Type 2 lantipeptide synthetase LanM n=2 Tax=Nostoc flagelliforme TaxID=1306274 RepID=A0ABR8DQT9_9NOSO|nr:type 2 lantipeptide synthetase LanM [Nostoc flagelliforme FACHB-838]
MRNSGMVQQVVRLSPQKTSDDLRAIAANASFLWERLDESRFAINGDRVNEQEINRRRHRWCEVAAEGKWDTLHKRLQWEGLNLDTVSSKLGTIELLADQPLPKWAETLQQIIQTATGFNSATEVFLPINSQNPITFEDILLPAILVARQQLLTRCGSQFTQECLPLSILSQAAYTSLERGLLKRLAGICTKTLDFEFSQVRPFGQSLLGLLGLETENNNTHYTKFVNQLLEDGMLTFFQKYPVLGRLVATAVNFWVEFTAEFLERLVADRTDIQRTFDERIIPFSQNKVAEIQTSISDAHKRGRTVILLTFESGLKLVYKPKDLGLEVVFNQFLDWCNQHSDLLDFKVIQVLERNGYGWVEHVEQLPCMDEAAAKRFYQRSGMLLCVLYALRGTDCHYENLIANGEHLVLIDMETLLHHEPNLIEDSPLTQDLETTATRQFWDSVLRTGLLPRWDFSGDRSVAYDISGLGSTDPRLSPRKVPRWQNINTDNMHLLSEPVTLPIGKNVPFLGEVPLSPNDYQLQITTGFEQMYRFLMAHKDFLVSRQSLLSAMQNQQVRFIFRNTRIYGIILQKALAPDYLKHGVDYSIQLDVLSRAFLVAQDKPNAFPVLSAELRAMEQLDIPFFTASAVVDELSLNGSSSIPNYFKQSSYQDLLNQLQSLDETDLARQVAIIQGSFHAKIATTSSRQGGQWQGESLPLLSSEQLIAEAKEIATQLETRAISDPDGSVNWIGLDFVPRAERYQLQVLNNCLSDGRSGVALFLAALTQETGDSRYRDLALRTVQSLRRQIHTIDPETWERMARFMGVGGATGLGSMIYSLVTISQFLNDATLLHDAQVLADLMTPELIAADEHLDIMSGAAGAILGLLSLHQATGEATVLEKAIACGQHLINRQVSHNGAPKAWHTYWDKPLTGFSHGAAGISYALLRLYAATSEGKYLEAGLAGIEYERSVFCQSTANWPDFRRMGQSGQPDFANKWCHGAAGIGLGRLGSLRIVETPEIQQEIEIALQTTQNFGLQAIDHLCCGNFGRAEVLLVGAKICSRPDWHQIAHQNVTNVVARAKRTGAYQLFPNLPNSVFNPGFLPGISGIGYQLLRLANNDLPSILLWD